MGIERRRLQAPVPEQDLNDPDIDFLFQQMGGETMAQHMHRNAFIYLCRSCSKMYGAVDLSSGLIEAATRLAQNPSVN